MLKAAEYVATPEASVPVPSVVLPSLNVTVPVAVVGVTDLLAVPVGLEVAVGRASVAGGVVPVVALFIQQLQPIAAGGGATHRAQADGLGTAIGRAPIGADGVAVAPDGSLYITDSQKGRIWRVIYTGK